MKNGTILFGILAVLFLFTACGAKEDIDNNISAENAVQIENSSTEESSGSANETVPTISATEKKDDLSVRSTLVAEQILTGTDGDIHYSYYLPEDFDESKKYPMMVVMPGYDMMWFGEDSSSSNLNWSGFLAWTELGEDMIVVSAQLTDWREKSARQAIELTEYFLDNFLVDVNRVYAAGYSAGGETMSQAVSMRPDLYAAYLHGASQWDGTFEPIAENGVAVYIFMAENDEYYGSGKARDAYNGLHEAYLDTGLTESQIEDVLCLEIPDNEYFNSRGIYNYHGGGNILFEDESILQWIVEKSKFIS
ncbi:MAG: prolyl oligopeptidase family serine peptidase [Lachnospiraceae bacterium]|nr:prolyl oligopeptidase family serine peptidase [Lachnospiraceae bacterium]